MRILLICLVWNIGSILSLEEFNLVRSDRIIGGSIARRNQFPYQVALIISLPNSGQTFCAGSILSPFYALTAAHCIHEATRIDILAGVHNVHNNADAEYRYAVLPRNTLIHRDFDPYSLANDVALIRVDRQFTYSNRIQPVMLPSRSFMNNLFVGVLVTVSGWGKYSMTGPTLSSELRFVNLPIISNSQCAITFGHFVKDSTMCANGANGRATCPGDSGGPVVTQINGRPVLIGVISFGAGSCGDGFPVGFARVTSYIEWIQRNTDIRVF